jgi:Zn-dependent peptidase ImmA (M78 family)
MIADYNKARQEAEKVWQDLCLSSFPLPILEAAQSYGLAVFGVDLSDEPNVSGMLNVAKRTIYINQEDRPEHQRFTIAHELGHWLMHREELKTDPNLGIYYRKPIGGETDSREKEANCFAANLLVPMRFLQPIVGKYSDVELAAMFVVSQQVIGYRKKYLSKNY